MDSLITAAARALAAGDPLGALQRVALREDAAALALRGIAMAQLGDFTRARLLMRRAARAFSARETLARARCIVAEAEIALASRDLSWPSHTLDAALITLEAHGDRVNAAHARYVRVRRLLLIGQLDDAEQALRDVDPAPVSPALSCVHALIVAGIAMRRLRTQDAHAALARAKRAAHLASIPALMAEVDAAARVLAAPAARATTRGEERALSLADVETLFQSKALIVDACRYVVREAATAVSLAKRPVLFALARVLAQAWPQDVSRDTLVARAFGLQRADESLRGRLRVEIGRLRQALRSLADVTATKQGFLLAPRRAREVVVLEQPVDEAHAAVLALLADGESWSTSALALALSVSQRTVQRALDSLAAANKVQAFGHGRARRWMTPPLPGIATTLLLPAPLPSD